MILLQYKFYNLRSCIFTHERRMMMNTKKIKKSVKRESRLGQSFQTESKLFHFFLQKNQHHHHRIYQQHTSSRDKKLKRVKPPKKYHLRMNTTNKDNTELERRSSFSIWIYARFEVCRTFFLQVYFFFLNSRKRRFSLIDVVFSQGFASDILSLLYDDLTKWWTSRRR